MADAPPTKRARMHESATPTSQDAPCEIAGRQTPGRVDATRIKMTDDYWDDSPVVVASNRNTPNWLTNSQNEEVMVWNDSPATFTNSSRSSRDGRGSFQNRGNNRWGSSGDRDRDGGCARGGGRRFDRGGDNQNWRGGEGGGGGSSGGVEKFIW
nr:unnamed protein product [Callosobruchus analis]